MLFFLHKDVIVCQFRPYGGTFFCFTDYARPSMRLASLMGIPTVFVMTHDSIGVGEDGPTHQPVEHLSICRATPNSYTFRPADTAGVAATVRICAAHNVAIVPQGGNTGLSYGTESPTDRPSIVLSLARLNQIESVDPDRWTITAQAGVTIEAVQNAAKAVNRVFAPDCGARGTASVGGGIATDAGGNHVLRPSWDGFFAWLEDAAHGA